MTSTTNFLQTGALPKEDVAAAGVVGAGAVLVDLVIQEGSVLTVAGLLTADGSLQWPSGEQKMRNALLNVFYN